VTIFAKTIQKKTTHFLLVRHACVMRGACHAWCTSCVECVMYGVCRAWCVSCVVCVMRGVCDAWCVSCVCVLLAFGFVFVCALLGQQCTRMVIIRIVHV